MCCILILGPLYEWCLVHPCALVQLIGKVDVAKHFENAIHAATYAATKELKKIKKPVDKAM